jgi:hypothetical protein
MWVTSRLASSEVCEHEFGLLQVDIACRASAPGVGLEDRRGHLLDEGYRDRRM